jgi:hypothetical protein
VKNQIIRNLAAPVIGCCDAKDEMVGEKNAAPEGAASGRHARGGGSHVTGDFPAAPLEGGDVPAPALSRPCMIEHGRGKTSVNYIHFNAKVNNAPVTGSCPADNRYVP